MTLFTDLDADARRTLLDALHAASVAISVASLGRKEETASEAFSAAAFILDSRAAQVANPLVSSIILFLDQAARSEGRFPDYHQLVAAPDARERSLDTLRAAATLVDARATTDEAAGYKRWLLDIATVTANAGKEDQGFLGRGGVYVNDAEKVALGEVAEALGVPV